MKNLLLVCNAGMSTSMLVKKMQLSAEERSIEAHIEAKSLTEAGTFKSAIRQLRKQSKNQTLKFLCSCIELSTREGANLESQIVTIEKMLERKRALKRKLDLAIQENKPLLLVSSGLIPGLFILLYLTNEQTREFWFNSVASWIVFFLVIGIFSLGVWAANRIIKKTANF